MNTCKQWGLRVKSWSDNPIAKRIHHPGKMNQYGHNFWCKMKAGMANAGSLGQISGMSSTWAWGKDFAASSMVLLTRILPHGNVDGRFEFFSQEYLSWCKQFHKVKYVNKIDKRSVGGAGVRDEPYGSWNKAALTVTILEFIEYFCNMHKDQLLHAEDVRLRYVCAAVKALNVFMQTLYHNELWIESRKARELAALGTRFVKIYCYLASLSAERGQPYFALKPKLHLFHEAAVWLDIQSSKADFCLNCLSESCSLDEDFVGRLAFISRSVSPRLVSQRSIERYLTQIQLAWSEQGAEE